MKYLIGAFALLIPVSAHADGVMLKASDLQGVCAAAKPGSIGEAFCDAYIAGLTSGLFIGPLMQKQGHSYCMPARISVDQARPIIDKYMHEHPEQLGTQRRGRARHRA